MSGATATQNLWLRTWNLTIGTDGPGLTSDSGQAVIGVGSDANTASQGGATLDLSDFRITFQVTQTTGSMPWKLVATVYNVPDELATKIADQFTNVTLTAGYMLPQPKQDSAVTITHDAQGLPVGERSDTKAATLPQGYKPGGSMLFSGNVIWFEKGRENATDTFMRIYANSFDQQHNWSMVNTYLPAGHTQKEVVQACVDAMALVPGLQGQAVALGVLTQGMDDTKAPRGRAIYGRPPDVLRDVSQSFGAFFHIDGAGKVNIVKPSDPPRSPVVVVNSQTGMVGIPHLNMDGGVSVRMLLNPSIAPGSLVQINQGDIVQRLLTQGPGGTPPAGIAGEVGKAEIASTWMKQCDGQYQAWTVEHTGDTRGNPWYTEITTTAAVPVLTNMPS